MTRQEQERIERVALDALRRHDQSDGTVRAWLLAPEIVALIGAELAKERRRVRRLITKKPFFLNPTIALTDWGKGYQEACRDILATLKGRRRQ